MTVNSERIYSTITIDQLAVTPSVRHYRFLEIQWIIGNGMGLNGV